MLVVERVSKSYRMGEETLRVLRNVHLAVRRGEFVALMGPSGSGKSTLMNIVGMLDRPDDGRVVIDGVDVTTAPARALPRLRREKIGFVFQTFNLIPRLSARRNVVLPMVYNRIPHRARRARAEELLGLVGLGTRLGHMPSELSGGERQRVAIARALANRPAILLADEPTGNLDSRSGEAVMEILHALNREGMTVLLVTHNADLTRSADRVVRLRDGQVIEDRQQP
ncbi:MAG: ABC transporter ATP-binding protein [Candidatus Kerfeldbacteria bacterium]|nr:ABC transporter ATP-binding protein [Candidatus Kerfeldbacteria bacterium]